MQADQAPVPLDVQRLLDRLDPKLDEPCNVAGCTHTHDHADAAPKVVAERTAA